MGFNIQAADDYRLGSIRMNISVGDLSIQSSPGLAEDHFRDLTANRRFLASKRLSKFFIGEEPLMNIEYSGPSSAIAFTHRRVSDRSERIGGKFSLQDALSSLDLAIKHLERELGDDQLYVDSLIEQVDEDIAQGVYSVYLNDNIPSGL